MTPVLTMTSRVGTNWSSVVVAPAFTPNVYRLGDPTAVRCDNVGDTAKISWGAGADTGVSYRILRVGDGVTWSNLTRSGANLSYGDVTSSLFRVQTTEAASGTTSVGVAVSVQRYRARGGLLGRYAYCQKTGLR